MILAVDVGSSSVKAGLFGEDGRAIEAASAPLPPAAGAAAGIDPGAWISAIASLSARLLAGGRRPAWVAVCGNGPTLLPVDAAGRPLHRALPYTDSRASEEAAMASAAARIRVDASFPLPKALWFMRREPAIYERTAAFLSCPEYVAAVLTGERIAVVPAGYERHFGRPEDWAALGLDAGKMARPERPGAVAGTVGAAGEAATGIPAGARVAVAGPDFLAALAGTASVAPGRAFDRAGSSEGVNLCAAAPVAEPRLLCVPHLVAPYSNVSGAVSASGAAVDWWIAASGSAAGGYEAFFGALEAVPPGGARPGASRLLFLPYLAGERAPIWDPSARGAFVGLSLGHGRPELSRAVAESTAFAMRDIIEVMEAAGAPVAELRAAGRPTRSRAWNRIKADATGRPILLPEYPEAELLGAACFALAASGRYRGVAEAAEDLVRLGERYDPDPAARAAYDELFGMYREAYAALRPLFARMARDGPAARGKPPREGA